MKFQYFFGCIIAAAWLAVWPEIGLAHGGGGGHGFGGGGGGHAFVKVTIESPEKIADSFSIAAQAGKGPDIAIWAHDKLGEWADGELIAPLELSKEFLNRFCPKAWQAVLHDDWIWGYPISPFFQLPGSSPANRNKRSSFS